MHTSPIALIRSAYVVTHERALKLAARLTDEQLAWQAGPTAPSVAFHIWHMARWADHFQSALPGMESQLAERLGSRQELWETERLAERWGLHEESLGWGETGMGKDLAAPLALPDKATLLDYATRAFAAAEQATEALSEDLFTALEQPQPKTADIRSEGSTIGGAFLVHLTHESRHLGMIECLIGVQGMAGSATI